MHELHKEHLSTFFKDVRGAILPLYAMVFASLIIATGSAIDIARAFSAKTTMQSALDAASTSALAFYRKTGSAKDAERHLRELVAKHLANNGLTLAGSNDDAGGSSSKSGDVILSNAGIQSGAQSVSPSLSTNFQTLIMGIIGLTDIDITVTATATFSSSNVEVALALALTQELCDGNTAQCQISDALDGLKDATNALLNAAAPSASTRYSIVPFSSAVNVGDYVEAATNTPETIQGDPKSYNKSEANVNCTGNKCMTLYRTNCVSERDGGAGRTNDPPASGSYSDPIWTTSSPHECVPGDTNVVLPLSDNKKTISKYVDSLVAEGKSAGHLGISWAWYTISEEWGAFWGNEHAPKTKKEVKKSAIFVADGDFNLHDDANSCRGTKYCNQAHVDAEHICIAMKEAGIIVYTVAYDNSGSSFSRKGLENFSQCASSGKHYSANSPDELRQIFLAIAQELASGNGQIVLIN